MPVSLVSVNVRGLRSYSPHRHKLQTIDFMPLTLIVGQNGSGKTTIIEALKFIISGEEPPLSDSRRNFLHTGKHEREAAEIMDHGTPYAEITLTFYNSRGDFCTARRNLYSAMKAKKGPSTVPTIESSYKLGNGRWITPNRLDDWAKLMPTLFNIPNQAILNHVVMCHQENNLWCMGDSASVKQVFDKIFGCEQYKKEVKFIDAEIKACKTDLSLAEKDLARYLEKKNHKTNLESELEKSCQIQEANEEKIKRLMGDIDNLKKQAQDSKAALDDSQAKLSTLERVRDSIEPIKKESETRKKQLKSSFDQEPLDPVTVPDEMLQQQIEDQQQVLDELADKKRSVTRQIETIEAEIDQLKMEKVNTLTLQRDVERMEKEVRENRNKVLEILAEIKERNSFDDIDQNNIEESLKSFEKIEQELHQQKSQYAQLEDDLSAKEVRLNRSCGDTTGRSRGLRENISFTQKYLKKCEEQLEKASPMAKDLVTVTENLEKMSELACKVEQKHISDSLTGLISDSKVIIDRLLLKVRDDDINKLRSEINKSTEDVERIEENLKILEVEEKSFRQQITQIEVDRRNASLSHKQAHNKLFNLQGKRQEAERCYKTYVKILESLEKRKLSADVESKITELDQNIQSKIAEKKLLSSLIEKEAESVTESFKLRDLNRLNLEYRRYLKAIKEVEEKLAFLGDECQMRTQVEERIENHKKTIDKRDEAMRENAMCLGIRQQLKKDVERIQKELKGHDNSNRMFALSLAHVVCNRIVLSDLDTLKNCFQDSVTKFHNHMIQRINEVLKIRWRQIYVGGDIDYIELVDEEVVTRGKKAYNYYVAMSKNNIKMKMREKSSSGQKALAAIILKMTLAELFVKDFAFIVLDEPTANLDQNNVRSLARTIGNYVRRRARRGANIQWIIITHDEYFLRTLDADYSPYYYKVRLDDEGTSKIDKLSFSEIESYLNSNQSSLAG